MKQKSIDEIEKEIKMLYARIDELENERFILIATILPITTMWRDSTNMGDTI